MRPRISILEPSLVSRIVDEALSILEKTGVLVENEHAFNRLVELGLDGNRETHRITFPRKVSERELAKAPSSITLHDRDGNPSAILEGDRTHFVPASSALRILDRKTQEIREGDSKDFIEYVKIADGMKHIDYLSTAFIPRDIPQDIADAWRLYMVLTNTRKPVVSGAFGEHGVPRMADLSDYELHLIATGLRELEAEYRFLLVDSAAGVSHQTLAFARSCDINLIVTTPDLTAMTDAYAFLKLLVAGRPGTRVLLLVNRAESEAEADEVTLRIARVGERFLGSAPRCIGWLPHDPIVSSCINRRGSVVQLEPGAEVSRALRRIAAAVLEELSLVQPKGLGQELQREVGYAARLA